MDDTPSGSTPPATVDDFEDKEETVQDTSTIPSTSQQRPSTSLGGKRRASKEDTSVSTNKSIRGEMLDLAQVEHDAKMKNYQLKHEILLLKKTKLEIEVANLQGYVVVANSDVNNG